MPAALSARSSPGALGARATCRAAGAACATASSPAPPRPAVAATAPRHAVATKRSRDAVTRAAPAPAAGSVVDPATTTLAVLGTGIMGTAMATRLLAAGYAVHVWNRTPAAVDPLVALGAVRARSPAAAAAAADVTFAMLADPQAATDVALAAATGLAPGKGYVDASTVDAGTAAAVAALVAAAGASYMEAPVSGSKGPAEKGELVFLCGGDGKLFDRVAPALDIMGKARMLLGPAGAGANAKLVINTLLGTLAASLAEAMAVGEAAGLAPADLLRIVSLSAVACPMFALKGPIMASRSSYPPAFPLKHQQKDLRLALALADASGVSAPLAAAANARFIEARAAGHGDDDFSAVREAAGGRKQR